MVSYRNLPRSAQAPLMSSLFRSIPSIEQLRQRGAVRALEATYGREAVVAALREEADELRRALAAGTTEADAAARIEHGLERRLRERFQPSLRGVINASGVIIHTNLGRAPLSRAAAARVAELATGYTNLEYDLGHGARGARDTHAEALMTRLTGAEAAVVTNNNAAATMLALAALAGGREVIVSRGELVEIGGGFRVPDVMAQSGALLREVGTTNKTRAADYAAAMSDRTALILRVHPSNFRIEGFTERPSLESLVAVARRFSIPVMEDLGSGLIDRTALEQTGPLPLGDEPDAHGSLATGADVVCFSGDKLLGGPQAGIIVGRRDLLQRIRRHPLMRALRVDKMTYAALEATLLEYAAGRARDTVPVVRMLAMTAGDVEPRARALADVLRGVPGLRTEIVDGASAIGGGSAPGLSLPTRLLAIDLTGTSADTLDARLRAGNPPVVARIDRDRLVIDLRTVAPEQDAVVAELVRRAVS
jgi:L-seryl-tRNA(Ser) seleniumtransferase